MRRVLLIGAMLGALERAMLEGMPSAIEPRGLLRDKDERPSKQCYAKPFHRQGKGERKRNRKHRWH